ncbi:MAG: hypothetical protein RIQ54_275 [Candidatus Parcubacteria bacterium]|jgi:glycosyltransferase involved in cell wall biosynthesis
MISIIIPTKNEEKALERSLLRLRTLTGHSYELIVSDGTSTDQTVSIAHRHADKVIVADESGIIGKIASGRNRGAAIATGEYLLFLDADVTIADITKTISHIIQRFEHEPRLVGLTGFLRVDSAHATIADVFFSGLMNYLYVIFNNILGIGGAPGEFLCVRRTAFELIGGFNTTLAAAEDNDLFRRLHQKGYTRIDRRIAIYHDGRRMHEIGWIRLLTLYFLNTLFLTLFKKSFSSQWKQIR